MKRALLLVALLLSAPVLLPAAQAAPPTATGGSPHDPVADVVDVAIAPSGLAAAAVMGAPFFRGSGASTTCAPTDFQVYDFAAGATYQGTSNTILTANGCREPYGRSHVDTNREGNIIATLGRDRPSSGPGALSTVLELAVHRVPSGASWDSSSTVTKTEIVLSGTAAGLAVSQSGERIVVAGNEADGGYFLRGYTFSGSALSLAFSHSGAGNVTALAATPDLATVVIGTQILEQGLSRGVVSIVPFAEGRVTHSYIDRSSAGDTLISAVGISPDGTRFVAGTVNGLVHAFVNRGSRTADPVGVSAGTGNVTHLVVSGDGSRLAVAAGRDLVHYDYTNSVPSRIWNYSAEGDGFTDLAYNHTGGILLAGVVGLGAAGFGEANATPFWTLPGAATRVDVNADATRAVVAQRAGGTTTTVSIYNLTRALVFQYPGGADVGQPRSASATEPATYEVEVVNEGAVPERVRFALPPGMGEMRLEAVPAEPIVAPGQTQRVVLKLAPQRAEPGDTTFNVSAVSQTSSVRDDLSVTVRQQARVNVTLTYAGPTDLSIRPTDTTTLLLGVENEGNKDTAVGIRATQTVSQGQAWNISVDPQSFTLSPNKKTTVRVVITPPMNVQNGTANTVTLTLEGQDVTGSATVTLRVNPQVGVAMTADSSARFVFPGEDRTYNVTIRNNGTLPREYEVYHDIRSADGTPWFAEVERGPYLLNPGANRTFQVRVFAPDTVEPDDRATITVYARSIPQLANETAIVSNLTLFAIAVQPPTPTPTDDGGLTIPAPGAFLSLTALLLMAVALRRRNSQ